MDRLQDNSQAFAFHLDSSGTPDTEFLGVPFWTIFLCGCWWNLGEEAGERRNLIITSSSRCKFTLCENNFILRHNVRGCDLEERRSREKM